MPNAAPVINSAMLDSFSPKTNDILTVNVSASDADSDPMTFDYVWKVNGNTVKSTLGTSSTNDTLDLSVSGNGNKGDFVSVVITPYDPYTSGMTANPGATVANTAPTFSISNQENLRGDVVSLQVSASDADGDTLSYSALGLPPGLSINSSTGLITGTVSSSAVTNQAYLVSVTVNDSGGNVNQNFKWTIVNDAPTASDLGTFYTHPNQTLEVDLYRGLLSAASDPNGDTLTASAVTNPSHGWVSTYSDGSFSYSPDTNYSGTDSFTYKVNDGAADSGTQTVYLSVGNEAPTLDGQTHYLSHDGVWVDFDFLQTAFDAEGDPLQVNVTSGPSHGTLTQNAEGYWDYAPDAGWTGTDWVYATVSDGTASSSQAGFSFTVTNANPVAEDTTYSGGINEALILTLQDIATDDDGDFLGVTVMTGPANGDLTLNTDGTYTYAPDNNWTGTDTFTVKFNDGFADSNTATISIEVDYRNPVAVPAELEIDDSTPAVITLDGYSPQGSTISFLITALPSRGLLYDGPDDTGHLITSTDLSGGGYEITDSQHRVFFVPDQYKFGFDSFSFKVDDGVAASEESGLTLAVNPTPSAPSPNGEAAFDLPAGSTVDGIDLSSFISASGSFTISVQQPDHGSLALDTQTGLYTYTAESNYDGIATFWFEASDGTNSTLVKGTVFVGAHTNGPLTQTDLARLQVLVALGSRTTSAQRAERNSLFDRMTRRGIQFNGTTELRELERILRAGQNRANNNSQALIAAFMDAYRRAVTASIGLLQNIDNGLYVRYRAARWAGIPHSDVGAVTPSSAGNYRARYGLERLLFMSGATVAGWENQIPGSQRIPPP